MMTPNVVSSKGVISAPKKRTSMRAVKHMACVEIKVQVVLQFGVCRGRSEVLLSGYGRLYERDVVSEFGPKPGPRCRDNETRVQAAVLINVRVIAPNLLRMMEMDSP